MGFIQGEGRNQGMLFPVVLDDLVSADHVCRVIDAFVDRLSMDKLGFDERRQLTPGVPVTTHATCSSYTCTAI